MDRQHKDPNFVLPPSEYLPEGFKLHIDHKTTSKKSYLLPPSDAEIDRLHIQHYSTRQIVHGNFNAPVEEDLETGIKVLDAGCGSGIWTIEMAEDYPNSTFVGIDIADMYPKTGDLPPNVRFLKANILEGLPFEDGKFDYVFQRFLIFDLSPGDWKVAIKELARLVKPGYVGS
ncbi:S-adenosyl-L-methionine-dependent methyltransferase [Jimgerdemannia flammicorona]|uniref:S-adenosyl-L-methionine-dependent methyltransferase n=1 Tax=Jimgerdemannia flammicorona TaxID=994334 RepID=A0A433AAS7_9FUNG|nr:S-adenosyl-L-methionine-dependent methyltransferase [Jimgerdemannia flammicorona]